MQPVAEVAYLFRHALLRDAAYQLQPPGARARLHGLALALIEESFGGRAEPAPALSARDQVLDPPHPTDPFALELAFHAQAADFEGTNPELAELRVRYLQRGALHAITHYQAQDAVGAWLALGGLCSATERAHCLRLVATVYVQAGVLDRAAEASREAVNVFREAGDNAGLCLTLAVLANALRGLGDFAGSRAALEEELALQQAAGATELVANATISLALIAHDLGRTDEGLDLLRAAYEQLRHCGHQRLEAAALRSLGVACMSKGSLKEAEEYLLRALEVQRALDKPQEIALTLGALSAVHRLSGKIAEAESSALEAIQMQRQMGNQRSVGISLGNLAIVLAETGRTAEAEAAYNQALHIHRELGNRRSEGILLGNLGNLYKDSGRAAEARAAYEGALALNRQTGNRRSEGVALGALARVEEGLGNDVEAQRLHTAALAIHREVGNRKFEGDELCQRALALLEAGRLPEATALWLEGRPIVLEVNARPDVESLFTRMRQICERKHIPELPEPAPRAQAERA